MADTAQPVGHAALDEKLARLSKKPGVKATIIIDRETGTILRTSGKFSTLKNAAADVTNQASNGSLTSDSTAAQNTEAQGLETFAAKVWAWVNASSGLVEELDTEDEMKLLRLRTKKQELVIVPDARYLLIVAHDTPPA